MCITIIRIHYRLVGGFIASFLFFNEEHERVYVYMSVCFPVRILNKIVGIHKLRCERYDVTEDTIMDLRSVQSVRTWQSRDRLKK
jgi:hypothetical protein